ncbi:NUDIX hydrolase [Spirosoma koreense]
MTDQNVLDTAAKYQAWHHHLEENHNQINSIEPVYIHRAEKDGSLLYALLRINANSPEGSSLHPICFLKGNAVSILVVLLAEETGEKYVLLVRQRRICDGSQTYEHPAGMIDENDPSPHDVAVRELGEETKLAVKPEEVKPLFDKPLYSATSTSDEALHFFYLERRMALADIKAIDGQQTGKESENEHTSLRIVTFPEAHRLVSNIHGVMSHLQYLKLTGEYVLMSQL